MRQEVQIRDLLNLATRLIQQKIDWEHKSHAHFIMICRVLLNLENYATIFLLISHDSAMTAGIQDTES